MFPAGYFDGLQDKQGWGLLWALLPIVIGGAVALGVKFNYWGWKVLSPGDRAFRERFGTPRKYFARSRGIFYIRHLNWIRMANVNPQTMPFTIRIARDGVGELEGFFVFRIKDSEEMVRRAIYGMYDPNRSDLQNDERVAFVRETVEAAIGAMVIEALDTGWPLGNSLTLEALKSRCNRRLLKRCGTKVIDFGIKPIAPVDAQIRAEATVEAARINAAAIEKANAWLTTPALEATTSTEQLA